MILAGTLSLLILGIVSSALLPVLRYAVHGSARAELIQTATRASRSLIANCQKTTYNGLTLPIDRGR